MRGQKSVVFFTCIQITQMVVDRKKEMELRRAHKISEQRCSEILAQNSAQNLEIAALMQRLAALEGSLSPSTA